MMTKYKIIKSGALEDLDFFVPCATCDNETSHKALSKITGENSSSDGEISEFIDYLIIQCNGCKNLSFCREYSCTEEYHYTKDGPVLDIVQNLYPSRMTGRPIMKYSYDLPMSIGRVYKETHGALCDGRLVLTGIGLRAIIESVCKAQKAKGNNLKNKISDLMKKGYITSGSAIILQNLRILGNKSAHEVEPENENVLKTAFDIIEHMLKEIYILPEMASKFAKKK